MKMKSMMLLLVAAGFGLVAMLGVMQVLNGKGDEPMVKVAVAISDIPAGMPLDDTNVGFKEFPQSTVPSGAVTTAEEFAGKALVSRAVPGEVIMSAKLGGADAITASHQIPKGMRVATVSVNATKSHSGLIRPTDRVDVVCTYNVPDPLTRQKHTHVKTVLEFIEVFAVDNLRAGREGDVENAVKNVSLIVDPDQFQLLEAAQGLGELNLSLRNRDDKEKTQVAALSDAVFFQKDTSLGTRAEKEKPKSGDSDAAKEPGLQEFLTSAMTAVAESATIATSQSTETPTWTMTIYRGVEMQNVDVLDEAALPRGMSAQDRQRARAELNRNQQRTRPAAPAPAAATPAPETKPAPAEPEKKGPPALKPEPTEEAPVAEPAPAAQAASGPSLPALILPTLP